MAVRRVSDLPNLDVMHQNSQLSNCLIEVSYTPNPESNPRLYQSFYENGSSLAVKVGRYLSNQFITADDLADLGIGDLGDLVSMLNALLNTEDLYLFVAQCGVPYTHAIIDNAIHYDIVDLYQGNVKLGKTALWKSDPNEFKPGFNTEYYTADKHDIIFFKSIYDAMIFAQRFKFLQGSGIKIWICTDLVESLEMSFSVNSSTNAVTISYVQPRSLTLSHSDSCELNISGIKITSFTRMYDRNTKKINKCTIAMEYAMRTIYRDFYSVYNSRYRYYVQSQLRTTYQFLMFDSEGRAYDTITYGNKCITTDSSYTLFERVAFLKHEFAVFGSNIRTTNCSFSQCYQGLGIVGGDRSIITGTFEALSCNSPIAVSEAGTIVRDPNTNGYVYVKSNNNNVKLYYLASNAICNNSTCITHVPNFQQQFISSATGNANTWTTVSQNAMSSYINAITPSQSTLGNFAVNPIYNALIVENADGRLICTGDTAANFRQFLITTTGCTPSRDTGTTYYDGPTSTDGYMGFSINKWQQTVISYSNMYDNYDTSRFNENSRLRTACDQVKWTAMTSIWDYDQYRTRYNQDSQLTSNIEELTVVVQNDPDSGESMRTYTMFQDVGPITPSEYSLINYRRENAYSFNDISYDDAFKQLTATMSAKYGYSIQKSEEVTP